MGRTGRPGAAARRALTASGIALLALTAACSAAPQGRPAPPPADPAASRAAPPDPREAERSAVLAAYRGMWEQTERIWGTGSFDGARLESFARGRVVSWVRANEVFYRRHDITLLGAPQLSPRVTYLDLTARPPRAALRDCVDNTTYQPYYRMAGKPADVPPEPVRRIGTSAAERRGRTWVITDFAYLPGSTC